MTEINQKEYLKKYISSTNKDKKKKRKKKLKTLPSRVKIIDDDADFQTFNEAVQEDLLGMSEDAPQIVGVIDDRPLELRMDDFKKDSAWKTINGGTISDDGDSDHNNERLENVDSSPPRRKRYSPDRSRREKSESPPPTHAKRNQSPPRKRNKDDNSPPRKNRNSPNRRKQASDDDNSPPRKRDDDNSPPRRKHFDGDSSPPRRKKRGADNSPPRRKKSFDMSPPRKIKIEDASPPRRIKEEPFTPTRDTRSRRSPSVKIKTEPASPTSIRISEDSSPIRRNHNEASSLSKKSNDSSPIRKNRDKKSRWGEASTSSDKMTKTLDGKTAGLQNAKDLVLETQAFKKREEDLFKSMSADVSGANATTIMRDRKTGKIRDFEKEAAAKRVKEKEQEVIKEKYDKWGKGTKQVEEYNEKLQQDAYEMSKPLARYADDEDLEKYLKEQEREGDPMLAYFRKKKKKDAVVTGKPLVPQYEGEFMPNRFAIRPGHRWDGVDRSNGYEKKWFEVLNEKQAQREEAYKWNTEDM